MVLPLPLSPHISHTPELRAAEARRERAVEVCGLELRRQHVFITYRSAHNYYILLTWGP